MWKKILLTQICICLFIVTGYITIGNSNAAVLKEKRSKAVAAISEHYRISDVFDKSKVAVSALIKVPATLTNYVMKGQESQQFAEPIDQAAEGMITSVYAVSGGQVIETGESEELGNYIKIKHDEAVSVYGNCSRIYIKEGKHVRRGQVIGSYMQDKNNEFYYDLISE